MPTSEPEPRMMDLDDCRTLAQAHLDAMTAEPHFVYVASTDKRVEVPRPRFEIAGSREIPGAYLFAYEAAVDPATGEREEIGGNLPLRVDRNTGQVETASGRTLAEFWPSTIGRVAAEALLGTPAGGGDGRPKAR